jgi:uncharacterized protein YodC (DUF2158 family)
MVKVRVFLGIRCALLAAVCTLAGCSSLALQSSKPFIETVCGKPVMMIADNFAGCSEGSRACAWFDGWRWTIRYPSGDTEAIAHEKEHVCGMRHKEPWTKVESATWCTEVTESGDTSWRPGEIICRAPTGEIRKLTQESTIEHVRDQQVKEAMRTKSR